MTKKITILVVAILIVGLLVTFGLSRRDNSRGLGSVTQANEYNATSTNSHDGVALPTLTVIKAGGGALGSVVITGAAAGVINIYDATSTMTNTDWATATLATIPASTAAGTYTYDIVFHKGLMYELVGVAPTSTITWR